MANDINQFTFTGRLGADPESRTLPSGEPLVNFTVACGKQWKDKASNEKREQTEWIRCTAFGKLAEICTQYLRKGNQIAAVGEVFTRKWKDKDGKDRYSTEVRLNHVSLMGRKADNQGASQPAAKTRPATTQQTRVAPPSDYHDDDSIPF